MTTPGDFTPRCRQFLAALDALCAQYGVHITPSGYDRLQIWHVTSDMPGGFDLEAIEDLTQEDAEEEAV